ncbi:MAG TPA: hypothetical protein VE568_15615 [Rubrobacter sp.]|nr:hypothetical protein [Rubrobacter sp.]
MRASNSATVSLPKLLAVELGAFGFFGLFWGVFAVLLADLTRALDLSPGPLGLALFSVRRPPYSRWCPSGGPPTGSGGGRS